MSFATLYLYQMVNETFLMMGIYGSGETKVYCLVLQGCYGGDDRLVALFKTPKEFCSQCGVITKASYSTLDTTYMYAIPSQLGLCVFCLSWLKDISRTCSNLVVIGVSAVLDVLHETCCAINMTLPHEVCWPIGQRLT
jgi:hypothetical protein